MEGWERPEVEGTVTKSTEHDYAPTQQVEATRRLERVRVVTEHRSASELAISTLVASGNSLFTSILRSGTIVMVPLLRAETMRGVALEYRIRAPRESRLVIHRGGGYVPVSGVIGGIEAASGSGDIMLMLPDPSAYAIDLKSKVGKVAFESEDGARRLYRLGERFARSAADTRESLRNRVLSDAWELRHQGRDSVEVR